MSSPAPHLACAEARLSRLSLRLSPAEELLLLCAQAEVDATQLAHMRQLVGGVGLDWQRFVELAVEHEVLPLVARRLSAPPLAELVPPFMLAQARRARLQTLARNLSLHAELERIADTLHASGVPAVPLKGTSLAQRLFGSLDARRVGDIDVLVPEARLLQARAALRDLGYTAMIGGEAHTFHGAPFVRETASLAVVVELHWGLNDPGFVSVDYPRLWERVLAYTPENVPLRTLPDEETLLYLALHLPKHQHGVLRLLADVDRLVRRAGPGLDWAYALQLAERWQVGVLLYFALDRSKLLFGTPLPESALAELRPAAWRRLLVAQLAGPRAVLRPPSKSHMRYSRLQLAYCAMLTPLGRAFAAYRHYLCLRPEHARPGVLGRLLSPLERPAGGIGRTALAFGSVVADRLGPGPKTSLASFGDAGSLPGAAVPRAGTRASL